MVINALRGHCAEFGIVIAQGVSKVGELVAIIEDPGDTRLPSVAREALGSLVGQLHSAQAQIKELEATLTAWHRSNQASRRLATIPGVGVITATALVATIGDASQFQSGRQLSAWLGLVPRQHSSGGKDRLGRISKRGDGYIRRLLVHGALAVEKFASAAEKTGAALDKVLTAQKTVTGEAAKLLEEGDRKVTADFHRWAATQRRYRFRLSVLALAVAVPAFFVLGVLLEQQFQIVPLHDPTSGWSGHIWQNYGRTIVDCSEDARRTNKAIECRFPVRAP